MSPLGPQIFTKHLTRNHNFRIFHPASSNTVKIYHKNSKKTPERRHSCQSGVFIVNSGQIQGTHILI